MYPRCLYYKRIILVTCTMLGYLLIFTVYKMNGLRSDSSVEMFRGFRGFLRGRPLCKSQPKGSTNYTIVTDMPSWEELEAQLPMVRPGGRFDPGCDPVKRVDIIVPCMFHDNDESLRIFIQNIHPFLQRQNLAYTINVVQMYPNQVYNDGIVMNAGFLEVTRDTTSSCVIFHDVDMLPQNDENPYACRDNVHHLATALGRYSFNQFYPNFSGAAILFPITEFIGINGASLTNECWRCENDDLFNRIKVAGLKFTENSPSIGRYFKTHDHVVSENRYDAKPTYLHKMNLDGLNSLKYSIIMDDFKPLYRHIVIETGQTKPLENDGNSKD